jgi:hypothetical protein
MTNTPPKRKLFLATLPGLCEDNRPENKASAIKEGEGRCEKVDKDTQGCRNGQPLEIELKELKVVSDLLSKVVSNP